MRPRRAPLFEESCYSKTPFMAKRKVQKKKKKKKRRWEKVAATCGTTNKDGVTVLRNACINNKKYYAKSNPSTIILY